MRIRVFHQSVFTLIVSYSYNGCLITLVTGGPLTTISYEQEGQMGPTNSLLIWSPSKRTSYRIALWNTWWYFL